jgi:hypothetical protein
MQTGNKNLTSDVLVLTSEVRVRTQKYLGYIWGGGGVEVYTNQSPAITLQNVKLSLCFIS